MFAYRARKPARTQGCSLLARLALTVTATCAAICCFGVSARAIDGDFGRLRHEFVFDDLHAWLGGTAANAAGEPASIFPLTDDERLLRDLAYPLIEPPYDCDRWLAALNHYGLTGGLNGAWFVTDPTVYYASLVARPTRSNVTRHVMINDDVRNDVVRVAPFFLLAQRVLDIDAKRAQSLAYISTLTEPEAVNARARNAENALIVGWVQCSLAQRAAAYRFALEHLVVTTPTPFAADVERSIKLLEMRVAESRLVVDPPFCRGLPAVPVAASPPRRLIVK
jgi:hypothetical protein